MLDIYIGMLKSIPKSSISNRKLKVYKEWQFDQSNYPVINATTQTGFFDSASFSSSNGFYLDPMYRSINHKYYNLDGNVFNLFGSVENIANVRLERFIGDQICIIPISQSNYGEGIKPGSVILTDLDNSATYTDNSYGSLVSSAPSYDLVAIDMDDSTIIISDRDVEYTGYISYIDLNAGSASIYFNENTESYYPIRINLTSGIITFDTLLFITGSGFIATALGGNVFYGDGLIITSTETPYTNYNLSFRSTRTIHEMEVLLTANEGEFNYSQNPSAVITELSGSYDFVTTAIENVRPAQTVKIREVKDKYRREYYSGSVTSSVSNDWVTGSWEDYFASQSVDPTGSFLAPFITTIGLYDDDNNMVAVAKLPKPIKNLPNYPINFLIRIDL